MLSRQTRCELCCFGATCCGVGSFLLAVIALELKLVAPMSKARLLLFVAAGLAFALMVVLTAVAVRMEPNDPADMVASEQRRNAPIREGRPAPVTEDTELAEQSK